MRFRPRPFYPEKESRYALNMRLDGPRAGLDVLENKESRSPVGIRTKDRPARGLVTILSYYGFL